MKYSQKKPCKDCPFLREGGIKLTKIRIEEIGAPLTEINGHPFTCHKTTPAGGADEGTEEIQCAGALIFAEKHDAPTQMMRISERLGMYDRREVMKFEDLVWDSLEEWIEKGSWPLASRAPYSNDSDEEGADDE